jgi:3-oxoacyl-[acyl-carrier protein] reductase
VIAVNQLVNKIALITGASSGIGAGIAEAFGAAGAAVVVNYATGREGADRTVEAITTAGGRAFAVQADVSKAEQVRALFNAAEAIFGVTDIVVNNAGVFSFGPIETVTPAEIERQFATNVFGVLFVIQEAVRRIGSGGGSIINISSIGSRNTAPNMVTYSATKGAVDTITLGLSRELGPRNIRVNSIAPGFIETEGLAAVGISPDMKQQVIGMTPLGRPGVPNDVARIAVFLASDAAAFVTGERIMASGGWR